MLLQVEKTPVSLVRNDTVPETTGKGGRQVQFVKNGPDIPEPLLQAHEGGRVVFFCGAGISYPAGLPGFGGLVDMLYTELGEAPSAVEDTALKSGLYDTAVGLLEGRVVGSRFAVRKALAKILTPDLSLPRATTTHEALLTLSKNGQGQFHLITTNFDRLFEEAKSRQTLQLPDFRAPLLPVPKKRWDGLVYLHGLLPESPTQGDLDRLVVSSGDFGLAYLTERWAARFVSELFRNYTVCFVGYSINDPVLRYMMDALAADRLLGESPPEAFAFGNYAHGKETQAANEWRAKNVTPILYQNHRRHSHLHGTLHTWAQTYRDGIRGKESIVARYAATKPMGSTRQDNFVGRMLWALGDPSGLPAKHFADFNPVPPIDWLEAFAQDRFGHRDLVRFGVRADDAEDKTLSYSFISRPTPYTKSPWMRLVHRTHSFGTRWDNVMGHIARWLARHLDDPKLLLWVADQGGRLDEHFEFFLMRALDDNPPATPMAALWRVVLADRLHEGFGRRDLYAWGKRLAQSGPTLFLRAQLRDILAPRVRMKQPYRTRDDDEEAETDDESRVTNLVDWEIVLATDFVHSAIVSISRSDHWQAALPSLLPDATELLKDAMDIMRELHGASDISDRSYWQQPSISEHPQNRNYRDWTALINLTRDAWLATTDVAPARAVREVEHWLEIPYPVFRRLVFFALAEKRDLFPADQALDWLLSGDSWWLWSVETQREAMRLVIALAPELSPEQAGRLQRAVLLGPPPHMFADDRESETLQRVIDSEIWLRLTAFKAAGGELQPDAAAKLTSLAAIYPNWQTADEKDEFPVWMGTDGSWRQFSSVPKGRRDMEAWLRENPGLDDFRHEDDWRERCRADFERTLIALLHLAQEGEWITDRWREALQAWSEGKLAARSWRCVAIPLSRAPDYVIIALHRPIAWWLKACAKTVGPVKTAAFFALTRKVLDASRSDADEADKDSMGAAINHPVGLATEAVLDWWYAQGLEDNQGLSGEVAAVFTDLCDLSVPSFRHGRLLLCGHAITLFRVDRKWSTAMLLPQFDWERSEAEARAAWMGFLWSPRLYWPLLDAIKASFLATAHHYEQLGETGDQYVALLTFGALEQGEVFSKAEFAKATASLPAMGLARVAQSLVDGLEGAADRRVEYWQNRIKPYTKAIWPKSQATRTAAVSENFSRLVIAAGEAFPDALDTLRDWLLPMEHSDYTLHLLLGSDHCTAFPEQALSFLDLIVPVQAQWSPNKLRECLVAIRNARPDTRQDPKFVRLETIIRQAGLSL